MPPPPLPPKQNHPSHLPHSNEPLAESTSAALWTILVVLCVAIAILFGLVLTNQMSETAIGNGGEGPTANGNSLAESDAGMPLGEVDGASNRIGPTLDSPDVAVQDIEVFNQEDKQESDESDLAVETDDVKEHTDSSTASEDSISIPEESEQFLPIRRSTTAEQRRSSNNAAPPKGIDIEGGQNPLREASTGVSTVFVIDKSGSMLGDSLPRVIAALKKAIEAMKEEQKFAVILFDDHFYEYPNARGLLEANRRNKATVCQWLDTAAASGGTEPLDAILVALQYQPEKVIVLSDGEFDPLNVFAVTQANQALKRPCVIDCIGLREIVETLKQLASSNSGIYYQAR